MYSSFALFKEWFNKLLKGICLQKRAGGEREHSVSRGCLWAIEISYCYFRLLCFQKFSSMWIIIFNFTKYGLGETLARRGTRGESGKVGPTPVLGVPHRGECPHVPARGMCPAGCVPSTLSAEPLPTHSRAPCPATQASFTRDPNRSLTEETRSPR